MSFPSPFLLSRSRAMSLKTCFSACVATLLLSAWVVAPAITRAADVLAVHSVSDGMVSDGMVTDGMLSDVLGDSLSVGLSPVTGDELDSADRSRDEESDRLAAIDQSYLWSTLAPVRPASTRSLIRPSLPRSGQPQTVAVPASAASPDAPDHGDTFPHSRIALPLVVGDLAKINSEARIALGSNLRPMEGAVVGVRTSYLRPRFGSNN
jgi:hypothetical protein